MKIENLGELKKLLKLCHEQGVHSIEIDGIKMQIGAPEAKSNVEAATELQNDAQYSDEELLMWSAGGLGG